MYIYTTIICLHATTFRPCLVHPKNQKLFKILRHIETFISQSRLGCHGNYMDIITLNMTTKILIQHNIDKQSDERVSCR